MKRGGKAISRLVLISRLFQALKATPIAQTQDRKLEIAQGAKSYSKRKKLHEIQNIAEKLLRNLWKALPLILSLDYRIEIAEFFDFVLLAPEYTEGLNGGGGGGRGSL